MTDTPMFRTTMRGYEPSAVEHRIAELNAALHAAHQHATQLTDQVRELTALAEDASLRAAQHTPATVTFADFGERVGQILALAEEEAAQIRSSATEEIEARLAEIESSTIKRRADADRYASETRGAAEREAGRIVEEAKRSADQLLDDADRQATARGEEAEALYELQRERAAKAGADFEQTLASRRDKAEKVFQDRTALAEQQLATAEHQVAQLRAETEESTNAALARAQRLTAESKASAEQIIAEAVARADRIRSESERELLAATQRRDSINAQLANVRHMLATLSGATPGRSGAGDQFEALAELTDTAPEIAEPGQTPDAADDHDEPELPANLNGAAAEPGRS